MLQATVFPASSNLWSVQGQQVVQVFDSQHMGMTSDFAGSLVLQKSLNGTEVSLQQNANDSSVVLSLDCEVNPTDRLIE